MLTTFQFFMLHWSSTFTPTLECNNTCETLTCFTHRAQNKSHCSRVDRQTFTDICTLIWLHTNTKQQPAPSHTSISSWLRRLIPASTDGSGVAGLDHNAHHMVSWIPPATKQSHQQDASTADPTLPLSNDLRFILAAARSSQRFLVWI